MVLVEGPARRGYSWRLASSCDKREGLERRLQQAVLPANTTNSTRVTQSSRLGVSPAATTWASQGQVGRAGQRSAASAGYWQARGGMVGGARTVRHETAVPVTF